MELVYSKNYFNPSKIFVLRLFKMAANQTKFSRLKQMFVMRFLSADKCKLYRIYRKMCDVYREACFSQNMFTNWLNMGLPPGTCVKNTVHEVEIQLTLQQRKSSMLTIFWDIKGPITIDFLKNGITINSTSYWQLLRQNSPNLLNDFSIYIYISLLAASVFFSSNTQYIRFSEWHYSSDVRMKI